ncbi:hypothetical protein NKH18_00445 [Streptomyces sp. M10(2022)]
MIPKGIRSAMADLGLWQEPRPLKPSFHLVQVIEVLTRYGWCQSFDFSPLDVCASGVPRPFWNPPGTSPRSTGARP